MWKPDAALNVGSVGLSYRRAQIDCGPTGLVIAQVKHNQSDFKQNMCRTIMKCWVAECYRCCNNYLQLCGSLACFKLPSTFKSPFFCVCLKTYIMFMSVLVPETCLKTKRNLNVHQPRPPLPPHIHYPKQSHTCACANVKAYCKTIQIKSCLNYSKSILLSLCALMKSTGS